MPALNFVSCMKRNTEVKRNATTSIKLAALSAVFFLLFLLNALTIAGKRAVLIPELKEPLAEMTGDLGSGVYSQIIGIFPILMFFCGGKNDISSAAAIIAITIPIMPMDCPSVTRERIMIAPARRQRTYGRIYQNAFHRTESRIL